MKTNAKYLVVGGDSLIGSEVFRCLKKQGYSVLKTTRRKETLNDERILLDFEDESTYQIPKSIQNVLVIAAATDYGYCETNSHAYSINVEYTPNAVEALLKQNTFVSFISTNSLFGGEIPWPQENQGHNPQIAYAKQKSAAEKSMYEKAKKLALQENLSIIRLTKILTAKTTPLPIWFENWNNSEFIEPFEDLIFAPMSLQFASKSLIKINQQRIAGNFHLSGNKNISYVEFARALAKKMNIAETLIRPTTANDKGVHIAFKPTYSGLGMQRTTELCGINAQPISEVITDILRK